MLAAILPEIRAKTLHLHGFDSIGILFLRWDFCSDHGRHPRKFDPKDLGL